MQDAYPLGEITLGPAKDGYEVLETGPDKFSDQPNMFMLKAPYRSRGGFPLVAETEQEKKEWIEALKAVIEAPAGLTMVGSGEDVVSCYEDEKDYTLSFSSTGSSSD